MLPSSNLLAQNCSSISNCVTGGFFNSFNQASHYNTSGPDPIQILVNIINLLLGFAGIVITLLVLYAGFLWMTSSGEEKKIKLAKDIIINAVIGFGVALAAWSISWFVITQLLRNIIGTP